MAGSMLPFVLFAVFNVVLGNMEPLVGGHRLSVFVFVSAIFDYLRLV